MMMKCVLAAFKKCVSSSSSFSFFRLFFFLKSSIFEVLFHFQFFCSTCSTPPKQLTTTPTTRETRRERKKKRKQKAKTGHTPLNIIIFINTIIVTKQNAPLRASFLLQPYLCINNNSLEKVDFFLSIIIKRRHTRRRPLVLW